MNEMSFDTNEELLQFIINNHGGKLHTEKDAEELKLIFNSGLSAKQDLITSLGIALLIEENKLNTPNKKTNEDDKRE